MVQLFVSNKQYGFIKGRLTVQQLLNVLDEWTEKIINWCLYRRTIVHI